MKKLICLLTFYASLTFGGGLPDGTNLLLEKLSGLHAFSANFEQNLFDINGNLIQQSTGTLRATKPNKLYWQTFTPFEQQIIADGEVIWLYDPDLLQVTTQAYPEELARTPAMLLIGETEGLEQEYDVYEQSNSLADNTSSFVLTAKNPNNLYLKVGMTFSGTLPVTMTLEDTLQQQTIIQFTDIHLNETPDASLFSFSIPEGVDVIRHD